MDFLLSFLVPVFLVVVAGVMLFVKNDDEDRPPIERIVDKAKGEIERRGIALTKRNGIFALGILAAMFLVFQLFFRYEIKTTGPYTAYKYDRLNGDIWIIQGSDEVKVKR